MSGLSVSKLSPSTDQDRGELLVIIWMTHANMSNTLQIVNRSRMRLQIARRARWLKAEFPVRKGVDEALDTLLADDAFDHRLDVRLDQPRQFGFRPSLPRVRKV